MTNDNPTPTAESGHTPGQRRDAIQRTIDLLAAGKTRDEAAAEVRAALSLPPTTTAGAAMGDKPKTETDRPHHEGCRQDSDGRYVCDPACPDPHGGPRCGYVYPPGEGA